MKAIAYGFCAVIVVLSLGCSGDQQQRARERASEAKQKTRQETARAQEQLHRLGEKAKREARQLDESVHQSLEGGVQANGSTVGAEQKLRDAREKVRAASQRAAVKLDRAALIAKVKAKLATDVGLSAASSVEVDASDQTITLRGTVLSENQKQEAEQVAGQVQGVTKVVNLLEVKP